MRELIMDGEVGLAASHEAQQYYEGHGIKFVPRAKEQQVAHIERRGALLCDTFHIVSTQCEAEGLDVEFDKILNDFLLCGKRSALHKRFDSVQCRLWPSTSGVA
jgi:hypothetical protein